LDLSKQFPQLQLRQGSAERRWFRFDARPLIDRHASIVASAWPTCTHLPAGTLGWWFPGAVIRHCAQGTECPSRLARQQITI
jgi:hypothetical protein